MPKVLSTGQRQSPGFSRNVKNTHGITDKKGVYSPTHTHMHAHSLLFCTRQPPSSPRRPSTPVTPATPHATPHHTTPHHTTPHHTTPHGPAFQIFQCPRSIISLGNRVAAEVQARHPSLRSAPP